LETKKEAVHSGRLLALRRSARLGGAGPDWAGPGRAQRPPPPRRAGPHTAFSLFPQRTAQRALRHQSGRIAGAAPRPRPPGCAPTQPYLWAIQRNTPIAFTKKKMLEEVVFYFIRKAVSLH